MNKRDAERILGLSKAYMHKDVIKAYRAKIKTAHPDAGGSTEEAAQLNAAKEFMDVLFANDKDAVFSVESDAVHEEPFTAARNEGGASDYQNEDSPKEPPKQESTYVAWWEVAYGKNERRSSVNANGNKGINEKPEGPLPWWYKVADFFVRKFPWRTSLILIFLVYFLVVIPCVFGGFTPLVIIVLYALFGAALVNAITGCFTNSIRKAIRYHADVALFDWQANHRS